MVCVGVDGRGSCLPLLRPRFAISPTRILHEGSKTPTTGKGVFGCYEARFETTNAYGGSLTWTEWPPAVLERGGRPS